MGKNIQAVLFQLINWAGSVGSISGGTAKKNLIQKNKSYNYERTKF
jgi:hypothetical protein